MRPPSKETATRALRWLGPSGAIWLATVCAAQLVPLTDVLGYEYAILLTGLVTLVGIPRTIARRGARFLHDPLPTLGAASVDLLALIAIGVVVSLLNALRVRNCDIPAGLAYAAVFPVAGVPTSLAVAFASAAIARGRRARAVSLACGVILASACSTLLYLYSHPPIVAYNSLFGYFAGSIYDESLVGMTTHLWFRAFTIAGAALALALLCAGPLSKQRTALIAAISLVAAVGIWTYRAPLGLEWTRAAIERELGGRLETEHFIIHYDAGGFRDRSLELLAYDHEARWSELREFWQVAPEGKLRSYVYGSRGQKGRLMGGRQTLVAKIWLGEMHIVWSGVGDELLAHEMAHLFLQDAGRGPLDVSTPNGLLPAMGLVEGAATAAAWGADELTYHGWSAAIRRLDLGENLDQLVSATDFWSAPSGRAYTLMGSFSRWLIDEYGAERFLRAYRAGDLAAGYDAPASELVTRWRDFVDAIELTDAQLEAARFRYDRSAIFGKLCARSIATRFDEAGRHMARREIDEARACIESILEDDPDNLRYRLRAANAFRSMDLDALAVEQAERILATDGASLSFALRARQLLADIAWVRGDRTRALAELERLLEQPLAEDQRRGIEARAGALRSGDEKPRTLLAVRHLLVDEPRASTRRAIAELALASSAEHTSLAPYLLALQLEGDATIAEPPIVDELLTDRVIEELTPAQRRRALRARAYHASIVGRSTVACHAWEAMRDAAPEGSAYRAEATMWLDRCARGELPPPPEPG